jgi:hypothetical protein
MTQNEALKLALEALETAEIDGNCEYGATEIIRKALAQPEHIGFMDSKLNPIQRTWVGLTNKDIIEMWPQTSTVGWDDIRLIEAKLKEKNFDRR